MQVLNAFFYRQTLFLVIQYLRLGSKHNRGDTPKTSAVQEKINRINKGYAFAKKNLPDSITAYLQFSAQAKKDDALSAKTKELVALGIALAVRCNGCLLYHMKSCKKLGVTREEILNVFEMAVMMGGGPVFTSAAELEEAMEEFYPLPVEEKK